MVAKEAYFCSKQLISLMKALVQKSFQMLKLDKPLLQTLLLMSLLLRYWLLHQHLELCGEVLPSFPQFHLQPLPIFAMLHWVVDVDLHQFQILPANWSFYDCWPPSELVRTKWSPGCMQAFVCLPVTVTAINHEETRPSQNIKNERPGSRRHGSIWGKEE